MHVNLNYFIFERLDRGRVVAIVFFFSSGGAMSAFRVAIREWVEGRGQIPLFRGLSIETVSKLQSEGRYLYAGKVRELIQSKSDGSLAMIHTDRLTAFDREIDFVPFKGMILNLVNSWWMEKIREADKVPTSFLICPQPRVQKVKNCDPLKVEVVVRGYLAGSLLQTYQNGQRLAYGQVLPAGLLGGSKFEKPILTPTTKADAFEHDLPTSPEDLVKGGVLTARQWSQIEFYSLELYRFGREVLSAKGIALVDTKYEFGLLKGSKKIVLIDEVHTPDSSRLCEVDPEKDAPLNLDRCLDKQLIRKWLLSQSFSGSGEPPRPPKSLLAQLILNYDQILETLRGNGLTELEVNSHLDELEL